MAKNLVIVESPAKGKTIEKFLWPDYKVVASMGHIRDLPVKSLWIDIENNFAPEYGVSDDKKKTVTGLKKLAKEANEVWIATDEDREWEAIGWHLCSILNLDPTKAKRIVFHEITKSAITKAVESPRTVDINLVDAQQARRVLDRLVWYKVSPILWQKIRKGLSAWRVQSVAVKLIVEKEIEIRNHKPEESWKLTTELTTGKSKFKAQFSKVSGKVKKCKSREDAEKLLTTIFWGLEDIKELKDKKDAIILEKTATINFTLQDVVKKESKRKPWAPFTTSTLQQEAARKYWFWVKQTMTIAQKLYEWMDLGNGEREGLITYMRTDSVHLSDKAKSDCKSVIEKEHGKEYYASRNFTTKSAGAQEAHEAIRPTEVSRNPASLKSVLDAGQLKLYTLIYNRTLASQMKEALVEVTTFTFSPETATNQEWITKWEVIKFDWFMKLYIEGTDDESEEEAEWILPDLSKWDRVVSEKIIANQLFSRPPARYTEASLVKKLESEWIGRPSTYAPTISTIIDRGYVEKLPSKHLSPTEIAFVVTEFLEKYFSTMMQYKFTKAVEEDFDKISNGTEKYETMLQKFWDGSLKKDLENAWEKAEKVVQLVGKKCPECKEELVYKFSKAWKFIGCSWYPECKHIEQPEEEKNMLDALKAKYEWKPCPDGIEGTVVVKTGRYWPFLASSEYPKVKWIGKIKNEKEEVLEEILQEKGLLIDEESWEEMVVKNSRRGPFLAAKRYPDVKIAKNIPKEIWDEVNKRLAEKAWEEADS
jgi:DNA topoisomerase I